MRRLSSLESRSLEHAEICYRLFLRLYPTTFRRAYEREMLLMFRSCYRDMQYQAQPYARLRFWQAAYADLLISVCKEYVRSWIMLYKRLFGREAQHFNALVRLDVATLTDRGLVRAANEDMLVSVVPQDPQLMQQKGALFVVADGMGGHDKGDVASELAVTVIREAYYQTQESDTISALRQAVEQANQAIYQRNTISGEQVPESQWMGTTCVAVVLLANRLYLANAGDSLAYVVRADEIQQLAQSHSWEQEQVRLGTMTLEEAKTHNKSNVITRSLGHKLDLEVYTTIAEVADGDILILCTDGLYNIVSEAEIRSIVQHYEPEESAAQLIARANAGGGPDNITAVVARISLPA